MLVFCIFQYKSLKLWLWLLQPFARIWFTLLGLPIQLCPWNSRHALDGWQAAHTLTTAEVNNTCQKSWHFLVLIYLIILASTIWVLGMKESCHAICRSIYKGNILLKHIPLHCFAVSSHRNKHMKLKSSGWFAFLLNSQQYIWMLLGLCYSKIQVIRCITMMKKKLQSHI